MRAGACIANGCERSAHARRLCRTHYDAAKKANVLPPLVQVGLEQTDEERFFSRVDETDDGCWLWTAGRTSDGYGSFHPRDNSAPNAHRWSYQFLIGPIPVGLMLDHLCRNRACVNPWHLEPVTNAVNAERGELGRSTRARASLLTHCPHGHEKTDVNTYRSFNQKRNRWEVTCRPCRNARLRQKRAETRSA